MSIPEMKVRPPAFYPAAAKPPVIRREPPIVAEVVPMSTQVRRDLRRLPGSMWFWVAVASVTIPCGLFAFVLMIALIPPAPRSAGSQAADYAAARDNEADEALNVAQQFVGRSLKCPTTAVFPYKTQGDGTSVSLRDDGEGWKVVSYVDSQNGFGAMVRTRYIATVKRISGDEWKLVGLVLDSPR